MLAAFPGLRLKLTVLPVLAVSFLAAAAHLPVAFAQEAELSMHKSRVESELSAIREKIALSQSRKSELDQEIAALDQDRAAINQSLIETSRRSRQIEERIDRSAGRLEELRGQEDDIRGSLKGRRAVLVEIIAALQRLGLRPPPALLVAPEDALSAVRSAILLGAVVPEIRGETEVLMTELAELGRIRAEIEGSRTALENDLGSLAEEEARLVRLLEEKKRLTGQARSEIARQTASAAELAARAGNLEELIARLETEIGSVREAAEAARKAEEKRKAGEEAQIARARETAGSDSFADTARITPALPFVEAKGLLPLPANGVVLTGFGQKTREGDLSSGVSIATRTSSRVISPADGWVIYAGPFRSYGQLLILNAGEGYHIVLAGMNRIDVALGQFVLAGEPVGEMGASRIASAVDVDIGSLRPVLYIEFRKDGESIDPSPWWAGSSLEERNG